MNQKERNERVARLTNAWIDGVATDDDLRELNDRLRGDPEACELHLDLLEGHAALVFDHAGGSIDQITPFPQPPSAIGPKLKRSAQIASPWLAIAALLIFALNLVWLLNRPDADAGPQSQGGVAVVSRLVNPEWDHSGNVRKEGAELLPGKFSIRAGLAQIEFFSGATVILQGPAELELIDSWRANCVAGKLRVFVPEPAQGFTIGMPNYQAVDLGTEFALSVGPDGQSEVHVVDGEVRLDDANGAELQLLTSGHGVQTQGSGSFQLVDGGGLGFIGRRELLSLAQDDWRSQFASWAKFRDEQRSNRPLLVDFDFEGQNPWDRSLKNQGTSSDGAIVGAQWTEGRWPGKGALEFKRITDRVRVHVSGEFDSLTLTAWVRIEGFDRWLSSLLLTDGFEAGEVHWQISDSGELILGIAGAKPFNSFSPPVIEPSDLGQWLHLAVTVDSAKKIVRHFVNAEQISEQQLATLPKLRIGSAEIGNWRSEGRTSHAIRSLNGRIDELAVYRAALSGMEIGEIYRSGQP